MMGDMSLGAVEAKARERRAQREKEKREHELTLQKDILSWIGVTKPTRGDILVLRVPDDQFIHPGTAREDVTEEQIATMEACQRVLGSIVQNCHSLGVIVGGAAIISDTMSLEDLPPPWEKHPDAAEEKSQIAVPQRRILLPPGTKI